MRNILMMFCLLTEGTHLANAQLPTRIAGMVPVGYSILNYKKGNLNLDYYEDYILVLKPVDETETLQDPQTRNRKLWILLGGKKLTWKIAKESEHAIYRYGFDENFPDCFVGVNIEGTSFTLEHYGGFKNRWGRATRFDFNGVCDWILTSDILTSTDSTDPGQATSERSLVHDHSRKIGIGMFNIYAE